MRIRISWPAGQAHARLEEDARVLASVESGGQITVGVPEE